MFRELTRKKQALSREDCITVLEQEKRGVLALLGDGGYPYTVPMNHWYCRADGCIYFHSGQSGHKIDALRRCDKASFCVMDAGFRRPGEWALNIRSVIVFGRIRIVEDPAQKMEICRQLSYKFTQDDTYIEHELQHSGAHVLCFALEPEHISGKLVNEA